MDDPRAAAGVEHLQSAAREFLKAARSFLDVVEDVVEDPDRLTGAAAGLVDVVKQGLGRRDAPWVSAAWDAPFEDEPTSPTATAAEDTADEPAPDERARRARARRVGTRHPDDHTTSSVHDRDRDLSGPQNRGRLSLGEPVDLGGDPPPLTSSTPHCRPPPADRSPRPHMKLVRIDELAPGRAEIELHPQLTVLRGISPEQRRRLHEVFRSLSGSADPGSNGLIEVSGVQLGLDRATLEGLRLDPAIDAVLDWFERGTTANAGPVDGPDTTSDMGAPDVARPFVQWNPPVPVAPVQPPPEGDDPTSQRLAQERERLRAVTTRRSELGRRMEEVRAGLDSFATAALEVCVGQIHALESRRSLLRSQWERDRAVRREHRDELASLVRSRSEDTDAIEGLDLAPVRIARDALDRALHTPVEPDPVALELASQIDSSMLALRELKGRVGSAEVRRHEAEQRLRDAALNANTAEKSMRTRVVDPADVSRLEKLRDEIFAFDDRHSRLAAQRNKRKVQELRAEEAVLLERLGFDTYSSYVMGIPSVRAELERSSRLDTAMTRMEQIERELQVIAADAPDPRELTNAEAELTRLITGASRLLGLRIPELESGGPIDPSAVATEDIVHELVTRLREHRIAQAPEPDSESLAAASALRHAVEQLAAGRFSDPAGESAPFIAGTQIDQSAWVGPPRSLLAGVDAWFVSLIDVGRWVAESRASIIELTMRIEELDREDLHRTDVSEWAVVEAELDAALDRMTEAEERVRLHDQAMAELAELRDVELGLRGEERDLLSSVGQIEQERRERSQWTVSARPEVPPTTRLPPVYRPASSPTEPSGAPTVSDSGVGRIDPEWVLIERLARQRAVSFVGSVPLLVDGVPADERDRDAVCTRVARMDDLVQIVLVCDDEDVIRWADTLGTAARVVLL